MPALYVAHIHIDRLMTKASDKRQFELVLRNKLLITYRFVNILVLFSADFPLINDTFLKFDSIYVKINRKPFPKNWPNRRCSLHRYIG